MGDIQFDENELILLGETKEVLIRFLSRQPIDGYMNIGKNGGFMRG